MRIITTGDEGSDVDWYDHEELEKFRGPASWIKKNSEVIYGLIALIMLIFTVLRIWEGMSFLFFVVFFVTTIVTIMVKRQQLGRTGKA